MLEEDDDECEIYDPQAEADYEGSASVREMSKLYILKIVVAKSTNRRISRLNNASSLFESNSPTAGCNWPACQFTGSMGV